MRIDGTQVRMGMVIEYDKKLWVVIKHEIRTPGNLSSFNQVDIRDIVTGTKANHRFGQSDKIERVSLEQKRHQYLYAEDDNLVLMDNESYEQIYIKKDMVGDAIQFLQDNMEVMVELYEGRPLTIELPEKVTLTVSETEPVVKGQTASGSYKPATMDNGARVMVPPFVNSGDRIVVSTADSSYVERARD